MTRAWAAYGLRSYFEAIVVDVSGCEYWPSRQRLRILRNWLEVGCLGEDRRNNCLSKREQFWCAMPSPLKMTIGRLNSWTILAWLMWSYKKTGVAVVLIHWAKIIFTGQSKSSWQDFWLLTWHWDFCSVWRYDNSKHQSFLAPHWRRGSNSVKEINFESKLKSALSSTYKLHASCVLCSHSWTTLLACCQDKMLFCDECDRGYHSFCVGLKQIPVGKL